eukprot:scaffold5247_cov130-Cylindrotheca_fusiformis.AAC.7
MEFYTNKALDKNKKKQYKRSELQNYNVNRTAVTEPSGLVLEMRIDETGKKRYYIKEIVEGSLWHRMNKQYKIPLRVGDRIIEINGVEMEDFPGLYQINDLLKKEAEITVSLLKEEKEKKWLHEAPRQYPGKMAPKEEVFRPEDTVYPPPKPPSAPAPAPKPAGKSPTPSPKPAATTPAATESEKKCCSCCTIQ